MKTLTNRETVRLYGHAAGWGKNSAENFFFRVFQLKFGLINQTRTWDQNLNIIGMGIQRSHSTSLRRATCTHMSYVTFRITILMEQNSECHFGDGNTGVNLYAYV